MVYPPQRTVDELLNSLTATYVTGSSLLSGSDIRGPTATVTNIYATNVTGSSTVSGSTLLAGSGGLIVGGDVSVSGSTYLAQYATDYGTVLRLDFEEGTGSIVFDSSPYGNDGVISGATWVDGKYGKALSFNGVNNGILVPNSASLNPSSALTISLWLYWTTGGTATNSHLIRKDNGFVIMVERATSKPWGRIYQSDETGRGTTKNTPITENAWHHIVLMADPSTLLVTLYADLQLIGQVTYDGTLKQDVNDLTMGYSITYGEYLNGCIDEVHIYNRALSVNEIRNLWLSGTFKHTSSVIISDKFRVLGTDLSTKLTLTNTDLSMGTGVSFSPPTGSASGSLVASLTMAVNVTGSTYYIQLWG